jgi:non-specific serine/threonine protein kinase/serine/threonine-protein kinase
MDQLRWAEVKAAFARVQEASPPERESLLAALPDTIRHEVTSLCAALVDAPAMVAEAGDGFRAGDIVGPYRLIEEIGRGGMGTVYRAERADGEMQRQLALKVAGGRIFAPEAERRFIQERQILARLDHPNIVRLIDGGVASGRRYFVMELAEGPSITAWCEAHVPAIDARVRLFRQVCAAVQYAHQHLVLHRDLKPSNVVVVDGVVKVLDFGIAQIVQPGTLTADTRTVLHPLSLACASPEQLRGEPLALTSDIYSLGTLLYEVLTGVNPQYRPDASTEEAMKLVLEIEPARPSTLVTTIPRDLDAITLKALAKRPAARYQSVSELDADLERWLDGRPVSAVPPGPWYFTQRFVRRNTLLSATAAALLVSVVGGAIAVSRQAAVAERRFEDARQLVHSVVFDIQPRMESIPATLPLRQTLIEQTVQYLEAVSRDVGNNVSLLQELANAYAQLGRIQGDAEAANLGDRKAAAGWYAQAQGLMDRALALEPGNPALLADAAILQAQRADFSLQNESQPVAAGYAEAAVALAERAVAADPASLAARDARARTWLTQGRALGATDRDRSLAIIEQAQAYYASRAAAGGVPPREASLAELYLSMIFTNRRDKDRAPRHARASLEVARARLAAAPDDQQARLDAATAAGQLASALFNTGQEAAATEYFMLAAEMREQILATDPDNVRARERVALSQGRAGTILARAGDYPAARAAIERSIALYEGLQASGQLAPTMEADFAEVLGHLGDYHTRTKNPAAACAALRRAVSILETADARQPLTGFRREMLDENRKGLADCR